jgi:hypothetical protein
MHGVYTVIFGREITEYTVIYGVHIRFYTAIPAYVSCRMRLCLAAFVGQSTLILCAHKYESRHAHA